MSISPRKLNRKKDKYTTLHMKIINSSDQDIKGRITYKIKKPDGVIDSLNFDRIEYVKANSEINRYDKYYIKEDTPIGRYFVEGRFNWDDKIELSETNKNDFFDVEE